MSAGQKGQPYNGLSPARRAALRRRMASSQRAVPSPTITPLQREHPAPSIQPQKKIIAPPPRVRLVSPPPKKPKAGAIAASIAALIMLMILFSTPIGGIFFNMARYPYINQFPATARFEVMRSITITSGGGSFTIDLPKAPVISSEGGGFVQNIKSFSTVPAATESTRYNSWTWLTFNRYIRGTETFSIFYAVETRTLQWDITAADSGMPGDIPQTYKSKYLGREWLGSNGLFKIDPQNKVIQDKALEVSKDVPTVYEKLEKIYFFLQGSYKYQQGGVGQEPKDALTTYNTGTGDCDEVSFLLVSMLRSVGIPAWVEFGMLYDDIRNTWVGHAWVQMYIPVVSGGGYIVNLDPVNYQFLFRSANRLTEWIEDGNGEHLKEFYEYITYVSSSTPSVTNKIEGFSYSTEGTVFMQDKSREIKYIDAPGFGETIIACVSAFILMSAITLRRVKRGRD